MSTLTDQEREIIRANVFSKTGIPVSKEDPIFALVEIIRASDEIVIERISTTCDRATRSLTKAAEHLEVRSGQLESMVDSYIQSRIEAANATLDIETRRLKERNEEEVRTLSLTLREEFMRELKAYTETQCIQPLREALSFIPHRSWLESLWTLAACLAIGFATDSSISKVPARQKRDSLQIPSNTERSTQMKGVFIALSIGLATLMDLQSPIVVLDVPSSIRQAFGQEHPFASHPIYRFSTDDAGIFYMVAFKEEGEDKITEYRYSNQDWLKEDEIADLRVIQGDPSGAERLEASRLPF